jgi:putative zinc finger protein
VPRSLWGIVTSLFGEDPFQEAMPNHLSAEQIARYRERRTPPEELLLVDDHISQCSECRERLLSANELQAAVRGAASLPLFGHARKMRPTPPETALGGVYSQGVDAVSRAATPRGEHLAYEQLEAYVDKTMSHADREVAQAHLAMCSSCSGDVRDLNTFRVELASSKGRAKREWWAGFAALWLTPRRVALVLATVVLIGSAVEVGRWKLIPHVETTNSHGTNTETLLAIGALPTKERAEIREAISQQSIRTPAVLAGLRGPSETLLGASHEDASFEVLHPLGEMVLDANPLFRWQPQTGATSYSVVIFDPSLNPVQSSPALTTTQWSAEQALQRGRTYLWQVTAKLRNGQKISSPRPPSPEAKFRVLDQEKADELMRFRAAHQDAHLVLGIVYAEAGILEQAEHELALIPENNPEHGAAQNLLKSISEIRRPQR